MEEQLPDPRLPLHLPQQHESASCLMGLLWAKARRDLVVSQATVATVVPAAACQAEHPEDSQCLLDYQPSRAQLRH